MYLVSGTHLYRICGTHIVVAVAAQAMLPGDASDGKTSISTRMPSGSNTTIAQ
jgi:hypothetical protein